MRIARLLGSVLLPVGLLVAGCGSPAEKVGGAAAPITGSPAPSATVTAPPVSASPTGTAPPPESPAPAASPSARLVLGPKGFGALRLGMTSRQATATGLIAPWTGQNTADCGLQSHLLGANGVAAGNDGAVLSGERGGVQAIDAYGSVRTPEGIHLGSSTAAMLKAYPDWEIAYGDDSTELTRGHASVPGNSKATYRMETVGGKVTQLTLQLTNQFCYE
jgi:hypothetical protein